MCVSATSLGWDKEVMAASGTEHTLFFASDYQGDPPAANLDAITKVLEDEAISPELAVWCGDYTNAAGWEDDPEAYEDVTASITNIKNVMSGIWPGIDYLMLQGNHDNTSFIENGTFAPTGAAEYEDYVVYIINKDDYPWVQGATNSFSNAAENKKTVEKTASDLETYLNQLIEEDFDRPVIVATHVPLHWSARSTNWSGDWTDNLYAETLFDVVNEAGKELDILFMFGHNHSGDFDQYIGGAVNYLTHGDVMRIPDGTSGKANYINKVMNFTYLNAGYMGYTNANLNPSISTATILMIAEDSVIVEKYSPTGIYEPATQLIELNQDREANPQIVSQTANDGERFVGDVETFEFSEGSVTASNYKWSCDDDTVVFVTDTDEKTVKVEYTEKTSDAVIRCVASCEDMQGKVTDIEKTYSVSVMAKHDQKDLASSAEKQLGDENFTYLWDKMVYIDQSIVSFVESAEDHFALPDSFELEYQDENGTWRKVNGSKCTDVVTGDNQTLLDGFYTDGLRISYSVGSGANVLLADWKVSGDDSDIELLADFDFDHDDSGFKGGLAVATGEYMLDDGTLYLDGSSTNWLNVTKGDGSSLLEGREAITVSMDLKRGNTGANWAFYTAPHPYAQTIKSEHYMGVLVNGGLTAESYCSYNLERPAQAGITSINGEWMHLDIVYTSTYTEIYINGRLASHKAMNVDTKQLFTEDSVVWIGKAAWGKGEFFEGWLDNYQIIGRALSADEIAKRENVGPLKAEFDFDDTATGFQDDGCVATGSYSQVKNGEGKAVSFNGTSQYLNLTTAAGNSMLSGCEELTVSFDVNPDNTSDTNWAFYAASANIRAQEYLREKYLGVLIDDKYEITVERYNNEGTRPAVIEYTTTGGWHTITIVFAKAETILYVDGEECGRVASAYSLSDILGNNGIIYLGYAKWWEGEYYKGQMDNVLVVGRALTEDEIAIVVGYDEADRSDLEEEVEKAITDGSIYTEDSWTAYVNVLERRKIC